MNCILLIICHYYRKFDITYQEILEIWFIWLPVQLSDKLFIWVQNLSMDRKVKFYFIFFWTQWCNFRKMNIKKFKLIPVIVICAYQICKYQILWISISNILSLNWNISLLNDAHLDEWYFLEYHRLHGISQVSRHVTDSAH